MRSSERAPVPKRSLSLWIHAFRVLLAGTVQGNLNLALESLGPLPKWRGSPCRPYAPSIKAAVSSSSDLSPTHRFNR